MGQDKETNSPSSISISMADRGGRRFRQGRVHSLPRETRHTDELVVKVSIIVNNYNYARFLTAAVDSALSQTYEDCEVIVVDDGSTDNSREVIESYGDRIRAIYKANGGQASALNAGFAASSGEIVMFLDADDTLIPEAAATLVSAWRDGVVRIQFPLEVIDGLGNRSGERVGGSVVPDHTFGPFGVDSPTSGNAFIRTVLQKIMPVPEEDWPICADAYLTLASSLFGEVKSLGRALGHYRVHGKNNWAAAFMSVPGLRRAISFDLKLHSSLHRLAPDRIGPCETWLSRFPPHWVGRIRSLRESPHDHPWPDDLLTLTRKALSATWRHPYWNVRRKLAYSLWLLASATTPKVAHVLKGLEQRCSGLLRGILFGPKPRLLKRS